MTSASWNSRRNSLAQGEPAYTSAASLWSSTREGPCTKERNRNPSERAASSDTSSTTVTPKTIHASLTHPMSLAILVIRGTSGPRHGHAARRAGPENDERGQRPSRGAGRRGDHEAPVPD